MSNKNKTLASLPTPALKALAKMADDAMKGRREDLGQTAGQFDVDQTIVVRVAGTIKVSKSTPDALSPQSAKPWSLVTALLSELNKEREAAGKMGIDIAQVVEMAESIDPKLVKKAQEEADAEVARIKEPTRRFKWGGVRVAGTSEVLASECNLPASEEAAGE